MDEREITDIQRKVAALLDDKRLKQAIDTLADGIDQLQDWELRTRFTEMQTAYKYMLDYMRQGMHDPDRERLHAELIGRCYIINDQIAVARLTEHSTKVYCQMRRRYKSLAVLGGIYDRLKENAANFAVTESLPANECKSVRMQLSQEHERLLSELFGTIWSSTGWSKADTEMIDSIISDEEISINDRATAVSAITLSTLKCFEPIKVEHLCHIATNDYSILAVRAITGIVIALFQYEQRIAHYPALKAALDTLRDNPTVMRRIQTIQIQLLRCRETQKIDRKMREEIIPAMMKNSQKFNGKLCIDILKEIENDEDKNPEWQKWIEEDGIKSKIKEMTQWQIEGADVYMSTFSQLKNYPFFSEMCNWLRPFDKNVPGISDVLPGNADGTHTLISAICKSPFFCNSDKYSFCLTVQRVPAEQRDMLMGQLGGEEGEAISEAESHMVADKERMAEFESNQYIQDLYRFFKVSGFKGEFKDPFTMQLNLIESNILTPLISDSNAVLRTFRYLVEKEYYAEAYNAGKLFEKSSEGDAQFFQEMGYCLQKELRYKEAIDYYTKADIIKPDTLWTLRHIAQCYRMQGEFDNALAYYQMAEELAPENISLLLQTCESFATMKQYEEAFARFYKVEFLKPGSLRATRAIAWCSFLTGKDQQARAYYKRLHAMPSASYQDYLNAGHVEWVNHNNAQAIEYYEKAKTLCGNADKIAEQIMHDSENLTARGVSENEILLLRDLIL